jgi:hypothetical protein
MEREESLDPDRLKKPAGRKPLFSTDDLLELIADEPLATNDWQKDAESELGMGRRTFFRRLKEIETGQLAFTDADGRWRPKGEK